MIPLPKQCLKSKLKNTLFFSLLYEIDLELNEVYHQTF